jgi:Uma2 family endonuclease
MVAQILDSILVDQLIADRQARGIDQHDEVWNGVYVMSPIANDEHQELVGFINSVLFQVIQSAGLGLVRPGVNLTDMPEDWTHNYRVPDVVVFLHGGTGVCHGAFWSGGPDLAVEISSTGERPAKKLKFYNRIGTKELLIIEREPWRLVFYRRIRGKLTAAGKSTTNGKAILSRSVQVRFNLRGDADDPQLVLQNSDGRVWTL